MYGWNRGGSQWNDRNHSILDSTKKVVVTGAYAINSEYIFRKGSDPIWDEDVIGGKSIIGCLLIG
jgi:hypothetical protein